MSVDEFRAQFAQAAGIETPPVEEPPAEEPPSAEPERDDLALDDIPEDEEQQPEGERLLANKYKSVEELERAYQEAQSALARQGDELSTLRSVTEEIGQLREGLQSQPQPSFDADNLDLVFAERPHEIPSYAQYAIDTGNGELYRRSIDAWMELDRVSAFDFHARALMANETARLRAELAPALQGMQRVETSNQFEEAFNTKSAEHEDFAQVIGSITEQTLDTFPREILNVLQTGDQASKERVLETIYRWVKAEQVGNLNVAAEAAARQSVEESHRERQQAVVASSGGSRSREPVSGVDAWREQLRESDAFRKAAGLTE